jgi:hypothetical protein
MSSRQTESESIHGLRELSRTSCSSGGGVPGMAGTAPCGWHPMRTDVTAKVKKLRDIVTSLDLFP